MDSKERALLLDIGRFYRDRIKGEFGELQFEAVRHAVQQGIEPFAAVLRIHVTSSDLRDVSTEAAIGLAEPSAVGGLLSLIESAGEQNDTLAGKIINDQREVYEAVSLADIVNQNELLTTVRMPRTAWAKLVERAGIRPDKITTAERTGLFPARLDFSGKRTA